MGFFLGIDGGGTKTASALADADGRLIARAGGPGTNLGRTSEEELRAVLGDLHDELVRAASLDRFECDCICAGFAGVSDATGRETAESVLRDLFRPVLLHVVGDMEIALEAAVGEGPGIVLIAGTGSICYGRGADGETAREGGGGVTSGDPGSGYAIGHAAAVAVTEDRADDALERTLGEDCGSADGVRSLLDTEDASRLAALTPVVQRAFEHGSTAAAAILDDAGKTLAGIANEVIGRLGPAMTDCNVVLAGGAFRASPELRRATQAALLGSRPGLRVTQLEIAPVEGAVAMARRLWRNRSATR